MRPNPPRLITVLVALILVVVGMSATVFPIDIVNQALAWFQNTTGLQFALTTQLAWVLMLVGDGLLLLGSLVRGL